MNDHELEARLRTGYHVRANEAEPAPLSLRLDVAGIARKTPARRRSFGRGRGMTLLAAAAAIMLVGGALAVGSGVLRQQAIVRPPMIAPSLGLLANASSQATSPTPSTLVQPSASSIRAAGPGSWIATGSMLAARYGQISVRLADGRVLVAGGSAIGQHALTAAELYNPDTGSWTATGSSINPLGGQAVLLRDGRVLVEDVSESINVTGAELYDPATGTWTATAEPRRDLAGPAILLADGRVLRVGDHGAQLYDAASGTWSPTGRMVTPRYGGTATLLLDGRVLVANGDEGGDMPVGAAEVYDPGTNSWTAVANWTDGARSQGRVGHPHRHPVTLLQDGTLLVRGETTPQVYDLATGTWTPTGPMARPDARYDGTATRLLDGTVLVAGDGGLAEVYDPTTRSWSETGSMLPDPWGVIPTPGSATLLLDGTVLVAGGSGCSATHTGCPDFAVGSAELYVPAGVTAPDLGPFPSPTPTPTPTPAPTMYPPEVGPVPQGARPWTVKVVNQSSGPATLFLAESNDSGSDAGNLGRLCGSVTPNVVPAGVTENVTFLLPPRSVTDCGVKLNPVPGQAAGWMFPASELPRPGYFLFSSADPGTNAGGWVGPGP